LEDKNLRRVFDALENVDKKSTLVQAPTVLMTDTKGFHKVVARLYKRKLELTHQLWDWHVLHYLVGLNDGFLENATRSQFDIFVIFCFGYNEGESARSHFNYYNEGTEQPDTEEDMANDDETPENFQDTYSKKSDEQPRKRQNPKVSVA